MSRSIEEQSQQEKQDLVNMICQKKSGLLDKDWVEICSEFDLNINTETQRKAGVGVKLVADAKLIGDASQDSLQEISDGYIDRQKIRDLTSRVNEMYRSESRSEQLRETIRDSIKQLTPISIKHEDQKQVYPDSSSRAQVLTIGDFHYGAKINVDGLHGETINYYDHEVFEQRMDKQLLETIKIIRKESINHVYVFIVGDMIDGMLRQSQLMRLEFGMIESTMRLSEYQSQWIARLSTYSVVDVYSSSGNHSEIRPLKSGRREFEDENLEKIVMWYVESRLSECSDVYVDSTCKCMKQVDVVGFQFLVLHGDGERRIDQIARDTVNLYGKPIDYFVCGHKHKEDERPSGITNDGNSVIIRTPSICGLDYYAQSKGYGGRAGAMAFIMESGYGRRCIYPINL